MFGGVGVYAAELFFALLDDDTLYFKVDDATRPQFEDRGMSPFRPYGEDGEAMHYYEVPAGTTIEAGAYLIVWADDAAPGEGHHAPFQLGQADSVFLLGPTGLTIDAFVYLAGEDGRTLARKPDREGLFFPSEPSQGAANP